MSPKRPKRRPTSKFSCGHPRTPENTREARGRGYTWGKCRICNNNYMRTYMRRRARQRLLRRAARAKAEIRLQRARDDQAES